MLALFVAVTLASRYFRFKYLDRVKTVIIQPVQIAQSLDINVVVTL